MDSGELNLFLKMLREEYPLNESQIDILRHRLLADDKEFEKIWKLYKNKSGRVRGGVDPFKATLQDLIS